MYEIIIHKITSNSMVILTFMGITYLADMAKMQIYPITGNFTRAVADGFMDFIKFAVYQHMSV